MPEQNEKSTEWHLMFVIEEDEQAELRFRYILNSLQADLHIKEVEVSNSPAEPTSYGLIVRFRPGKMQPANKSLHHLDKVYGTSPLVRRSRYDRLMDEKDPFDD